MINRYLFNLYERSITYDLAYDIANIATRSCTQENRKVVSLSIIMKRNEYAIRYNSNWNNKVCKTSDQTLDIATVNHGTHRQFTREYNQRENNAITNPLRVIRSQIDREPINLSYNKQTTKNDINSINNMDNANKKCTIQCNQSILKISKSKMKNKR